MVSLTDNSVKCSKVTFAFYGTVYAISLNCYSCLHIVLAVSASHLKVKVVCIMWLPSQMTSGFIVIRVSSGRHCHIQVILFPIICASSYSDMFWPIGQNMSEYEGNYYMFWPKHEVVTFIHELVQ